VYFVSASKLTPSIGIRISNPPSAGSIHFNSFHGDLSVAGSSVVYCIMNS
jgi:hypothetical protein